MFRRPLTRLENNIGDLAEYEATKENRRLERSQKLKDLQQKSIPKSKDERIGYTAQLDNQKITLETPKNTSRL